MAKRLTFSFLISLYFLISGFSLTCAKRLPNRQVIPLLNIGSSQILSYISTNYSSALTNDHPQYDRNLINGQPLHYYETIEIKSSMTQNVTLTSSSTKDLYGCLYQPNFDPFSQNTSLLDCDDDSVGNEQFEIQYSLNAGVTYILVVTTFSGGVVAPFAIEAIHLSNTTIEFNSTANISSSISNGLLSNLGVNTYTYQWALNGQSSKYARYAGATVDYYYEAIEVNVSTIDMITLISNSTTDLFAYLYNGTFNQSNSSINLMSSDDDGGRNQQFRLRVVMDPIILYTLVVTTFYTNVKGSFTVIAYSNNATVEFRPRQKMMTTQSFPSSTEVTSSLPFMTTQDKVTSTITANISGCSLPRITLIPGITSLRSPAQFRRSQDFYISSDIVIDCSLSLSIQTQWTITLCQSTCSNMIQSNRLQIATSNSELYIPARTLDFGVYQMRLTVRMVNVPNFTQSTKAYVAITPSGITANLVPLGTSIITGGREKDLILDPGRYSVDPDLSFFNASDWFYQYYCRPYDLYRPISSTPLQSIDQPTAACFASRSRTGQVVQYGSWNSSTTILSNSLQVNQTYQFLVTLVNRRNGSRQVTGYLLVKVEDTKPQLIAVSCVISTMCSPNAEYQFVNPSTQVSLYSICIGDCTTLMNIHWWIYQGFLNQTTNVVEWTSLTINNSQVDERFFGRSTSNFTATTQLFNNENISYWRFEAVYTFQSAISSSALNFRVNQTPRNGSCSINPDNGTTSTSFTIQCSQWVDDDGIKDYSIYIFNDDEKEKSMIAYAVMPRFNLRLPAGRNNQSTLNILVQIRDVLNGVTNYYLNPIVVTPDRAEVSTLIETLREKRQQMRNNNPTMKSLASGNPNVVGQILTSVSQVFNQINRESIVQAVANGVPTAKISVSSLASRSEPQSSANINASALKAFQIELNSYAKVRDHLVTFIRNLPITTPMSVNLQASTLAQITESTNQLTRDASILAAVKCRQLSEKLQSLASQIAYEDVQLAANHLSQCASNVLTAINGPLQDRTSTLDLDDQRANTFPDDYDTDLESEWANQKLFAEDDDFSWETIQRGRNRYYQKQTAKTIEQHVENIYRSITAALSVHLNLGQKMIINSSSVFVSMETISIDSLSNRVIEQVGGAQIRLPSSLNLSLLSSNTNYSSITLRSVMQPLASSGQSRTNVSTSVSLTLIDSNGNEIPFRVGIDQPIELIIPRDPNLIVSPFYLQNLSSISKDNRTFNSHFINITRTNNLSLSVHLEIHPLNISNAFWLIYRFDRSPQVNSSIELIDGWSLLCPSMITGENIYRYSIDNQQISNHQSIVFGLRQLNSTEQIEFCSNFSLNVSFPRQIFDTPMNVSSNYELRSYTSGCYYLDSNQLWQSDGLIVGPLTNYSQTHCFSTHLTTFAGGFLALPEPINWNYVFAHADFLRNKTIYLTVIIIIVLYIVLLLFSRYYDRKDRDKFGMTVLTDNHNDDRYFYEILVFTGHRRSAGTNSKVHFVLGGDDQDSGIRTFFDPNRKIFQRGSIDGFVLAVPKCLGTLNYLRLWHDNSGDGSSASWFLKYVLVHDLQTRQTSHFICQRWLAVEEEDGSIERLLPVASEEEKRDFRFILSKQAYQSASDGHLWFSIFARPSTSSFTRVQRCTCCFVLLFTSMLFNILYYDQMKETESMKMTNGLTLGPLRITSQQIGIGIIVELLSLVPSLLLVGFFRRIRSPQTTVKNKKHHWTFPSWCLFIAYGLSFLIIAVSILFVIARGIEFGDRKTQQWLISLIIGFFSSILLTQPLKVIVLAILFAYFCRNRMDDETECDNADDLVLENDQISTPIYRPRTPINRLNDNEVEFARRSRIKLIKMNSILHEIFAYACFIWMIFVISYSNRTPNAFLQVQHLRNFLLNIGDGKNDYTKIVSINDYWKWLEESFVENLRAQRWYNGEPPRNLSGFLNDRSNRLIGWVVMKQRRNKINPNGCPSKLRTIDSQHTCKDDLSRSNEDRLSYLPGWNQSNETINGSFAKSFEYRDHEGYVYEFRGSLLNLRQNLSILHRFNWIDDRTRSIQIQISLYNPNIQLFTSVALLMEFLTTGGLMPTSRIDPIDLQNFSSAFDLIISIVYMFFVTYLMFTEIRLSYQLKWNYFRQFWSYIQWGIIICSWIACGIYLWRHYEINRLGDLFRQTQGDIYVDLRFTSYINDLLTFQFGFCCFFASIKLLRFAKYARRLSIYGETIAHASKDLFHFTLSFLLVFFAFLLLFFLLFASKILACSSLLHTAQMLFEMILMKFDTSELLSADALLGPICFTIFIFFIVFVGMTMFISIISDSFRIVRNQIKSSTDDDREMFAFILDRFQKCTGIKKSNHWEQQDQRIRSNYLTPAESFPEKIDQLIVALNKINPSISLPKNK